MKEGTKIIQSVLFGFQQGSAHQKVREARAAGTPAAAQDQVEAE